MAVALNCVEDRVPTPMAIHCSYPALNATVCVAPARLLSMCDALLPSGVLVLCLQSYMQEFTYANEPHFLASPYHAPDEYMRQLPRVYMNVSELDPLLDGGIDLARRLRRLGVDVTLHVSHDAPHGFLQLMGAGKQVEDAKRVSLQHLQEIFA